MSDLVNISDFSYTSGLNIGKNNQSFTYLYGLADFWQYLFQDTDSANLMLEATSVQASDVYSKFLQLCSGISIADIADSASSQLMLQILSDASVSGVTLSNIQSGVWNGGFTTLKLVSNSGFNIGDVIVVNGVTDIITYNVGNGINTNPINSGGSTSIISGSSWNGTFTITGTALGGYVTYFQATDPGPYTSGGSVSLFSIGVETYVLPEKIVASRFIANRPFLPTVVLEEGVDFSVNPSTYRVSFAQPLSSYGFPARKTSTGSTEYSLWFSDVRYDEDLIYENFPKLLGLPAVAASNEAYRGFLYGLFFIYTSGPTLSVMEKGINLILGVPLARDNEVVLEIRNYIGTNQVMIITDMNSYLLPLGLNSVVSIGQSISVGDELAKWVEIIDSESQPAWWNSYAIELPPSLLPFTPTGQTRQVTGDPGNYANWIMTNYLRKNIFLVKANVSATTFISVQQFESISTIISNLKPNHTVPVYYYNSITPLVSVFTQGTVGRIGPDSSIGTTGVSSFSGVISPTAGLLMGSVTLTSATGSLLKGLQISLSGAGMSGTVGVVSGGGNLLGTSISLTAGSNGVGLTSNNQFLGVPATASVVSLTTTIQIGNNLSASLNGVSSSSTVTTFGM